jgi:hypothetical protein
VRAHWTRACAGATLDLALELVCEDKEKNMSSLLLHTCSRTPEMLTIPAFCVPAPESGRLEAKRQAQLEWMRAQGIRYILWNPVERQTPLPVPHAA